MRTSDKGQEFIRSYEKFRPNAYPDSAGRPTIGYGHLIKPGETFYSITELTAEKIFRDDLQTAENEVNSAIDIAMTQQQFDAMVSLCYNIGSGNFDDSTLVTLFNANKIDEAALQFPRWDKSGGEVSQGLLDRRNAEMAIFQTGNYTDHQ